MNDETLATATALHAVITSAKKEIVAAQKALCRVRDAESKRGMIAPDLLAGGHSFVLTTPLAIAVLEQVIATQRTILEQAEKGFAAL